MYRQGAILTTLDVPTGSAILFPCGLTRVEFVSRQATAEDVEIGDGGRKVYYRTTLRGVEATTEPPQLY